MKIIASSRDVWTHWPLPVVFALQERHHAGLGQEHARRQVGNRDADADRALSRQPGDRHQPAHALGDLVDAGAFRVRTALAEARDAAIDDPRIDLGHRVVVDAEPGLNVGTEVLDDDIDLLGKLEEDRLAFLALEVERKAALVAVQVLVVRPLDLAAHGVAARFRDRPLDLDHVGPPVGKLANGGGAGTMCRQIENLETGKWQLTHGKPLRGRRAVGPAAVVPEYCPGFSINGARHAIQSGR
jgi:hypothetical protein